MSTQRATASDIGYGSRQGDVTESFLQNLDQASTRTLGVSFLRVMTIASISASIALYLSGRRHDGIFVGLWAPTFEALKASVDRENERRSSF